MLFLFFTLTICYPADRDSINIYYSTNQSFVDIVDSISNVEKKHNIKRQFQQQNFYIFFSHTHEGLLMYITQCRLFEDEFGSEYIPFGCIIKNDSYFYLLNMEELDSYMDLLFHKTDNYLIPSLVPRKNEDEEIANHVYFIYRGAKLFRFDNGTFEGINR